MNTLPLPTVEEISIEDFLSALREHNRVDLTIPRAWDRCADEAEGEAQSALVRFQSAILGWHFGRMR